MIKRNEAVDAWLRLTQHPNPTEAVRLIAAACEHALDDPDGGSFLQAMHGPFDVFFEHLKAALDSDLDAPKANVKFDRWSSAGYWIDFPEELVNAWAERGDPERPCVRVRVYRLNEKTRKYKHEGYLDPPEVTFETIQARFGGGIYRFELLDGDRHYCTSVSNVGIGDPSEDRFHPSFRR